MNEEGTVIVSKSSATYKPIKVVLYGSYARGDQQEYSDIDVAVHARTH
jgi:predicted nucleotidyltransferase